MSGIFDKERREQLDLIAKWIIAIVAGFWTLYAGADLINRDNAALDLSNKALSSASLPTADHEMIIDPVDTSLADIGLCYLDGKFAVTNTGDLALQFEEVVFEIYKLPYVYLKPDEDVTARILLDFMDGQKPIKTWPIKWPERIGKGNRMERVFSFTFRKVEDADYVVVARAIGGLALADDDIDDDIREFSEFGSHDVEHFHVVNRASHCPSGQS